MAEGPPSPDRGVGELYKERIMEHARRPRHFGPLADATHRASGHNPLCGDRLTLLLRCEGELVAEVAFEGAGCALSMASASLLTEAIAGRTRPAALAFQASVMEMLGGAAADPEALGEVSALSAVRAFPARVKCVTLAWQTLASAFDERPGKVTTE